MKGTDEMMKRNNKKILGGVAGVLAAIALAVQLMPVEAEAKASYDTKHTQQLSFENLMTSAFVKEMDAKKAIII